MASSSSTSGSGSSQSVPSSMDSAGTLPTQDCVDGIWSESDETDEPFWGRLYPIGKGFTSLDLKKDSYQFGRDTDSDVCFTPAAFSKNAHFQALSKKHFELIKESGSLDSTTGSHVVYIRDWSSNGTFLNGGKIGKGNKQVIQNNDEISLARPENRAYIFIDLKNKEQERLPKEVNERYTLSKVLGRGACGEVRLAFEKGGECGKFAMKIISKNKFSSCETADKEKTFEEVEILKKLDHPCIVKVIDVFDTPESLFIVLELVEGGELFYRVLSRERLEEPVAKLLFYQILNAVKYLHDKGFTHRDLKPENVLLCSPDSDDTLVKITDFGVSKFVGEQSLMKTLCGTPSYLAPEVLSSRGERAYKKECDCWSLGVILFVCLGGHPPFSGRTKEILERQVIQGKYSFPEHKWRGVSDEARDLICKLLTVDPNKRISVANALEHPWMQDEAMISKAKELMSPANSQGLNGKPMPPPAPSISKRKNDTESPPTKRRKSTES